jgi:hypothetical protein
MASGSATADRWWFSAAGSAVIESAEGKVMVEEFVIVG